MVKRKVIVITDGDRVAQKVVEKVAKNVGGRAISLSGGNPTRVTGSQIAAAIKETPYDPVLVMVDDCGDSGKGPGETALEELARDPEIEILGALAVASNTAHADGARVDAAVTRDRQVIAEPVDKDGLAEPKGHSRVEGDTTANLDRLKLPVVIGIGDLGKMDDADLVEHGAVVTTKAVQEILRRSNYSDK